jgi:hypothetical protein
MADECNPMYSSVPMNLQYIHWGMGHPMNTSLMNVLGHGAVAHGLTHDIIYLSVSR